MTARRQKVLPNGRNGASQQGRFVRLPHDLLNSAAYRSLGLPARQLLVELTSFHNNKNNGTIWLSEDDAARRLGVGCPKIVRRAYGELSEAGFIAMTKDSHFNIKVGQGRARTWRLTWLGSAVQPHIPTNEWKSFVPTNKQASKRADKGLRAIAAYRKQVVQNQNTGGKSPATIEYPAIVQVNLPATIGDDNENPPFLKDCVQGNSPSYIAVTILPFIARAQMGWWRQKEMGLAMSRLMACMIVVQMFENNMEPIAA